MFSNDFRHYFTHCVIYKSRRNATTHLFTLLTKVYPWGILPGDRCLITLSGHANQTRHLKYLGLHFFCVYREYQLACRCCYHCLQWLHLFFPFLASVFITLSLRKEFSPLSYVISRLELYRHCFAVVKALLYFALCFPAFPHRFCLSSFIITFLSYHIL